MYPGLTRTVGYDTVIITTIQAHSSGICREGVAMVTKRERSAIGRQLSGLRRKVRAECQHCGGPMTGTTKRRWCSVACRQAAYRKRKAEGRDEGGLATAGNPGQ